MDGEDKQMMLEAKRVMAENASLLRRLALHEFMENVVNEINFCYSISDYTHEEGGDAYINGMQEVLRMYKEYFHL